jgi:hypothetical protein
MCLVHDENVRRVRVRLAAAVLVLAGVSWGLGLMHVGANADLIDFVRGLPVGIALGMILFTFTP